MAEVNLYTQYMSEYETLVQAFGDAYIRGNESEMRRLTAMLELIGADFVNGRWFLDEDAY